MFLLPFSKISKHNAAIAGGKGASLGEMTSAGIPVPPGFVLLSTAFERFIEETDLNVEIDNLLHDVDIQAMHTVERASEGIQHLILQAKMPEDIRVEIEKEFKKLKAPFVAVRSSATAEDSASAAWAGQLDSFLNTTHETLLKNVQKCWASLFTPRAIFYRFEKGLHAQKISVAVVIQKMVQSEVSGIAFSVHPVTEDYNQLIIEAGYGLGEAIVSGQITPDSYVVEKDVSTVAEIATVQKESKMQNMHIAKNVEVAVAKNATTREGMRILDKNIVTQERGLYRVSSHPSPRRNAGELPSDRGAGNTSTSSPYQGEVPKGRRGSQANEWQSILPEKGSQQKLSDQEILELSLLIVKIEKHYGFPCDIEWAFEQGNFYITQSRPITTLTKNKELSESSVVPKSSLSMALASDEELHVPRARERSFAPVYLECCGSNQPRRAGDVWGHFEF